MGRTQYKIAIMVETIFKQLGNKKALSFVDNFKRKLEGVNQLTKYGNVGKKLGMGIKQGVDGLKLYDLKSQKVFKNQEEAMQRMNRAMNRTKAVQPPFGGRGGSAGFNDIQKMTKTNLMFEELQSNAKKLGYTVTGTSKKMSLFQNGVKLTGKNARTAFTSIGRHAEKMRGEFDMSYLSIMFFGMAIQRLFSGLIKMGIGTYKELTKNNTEASNAVTHLEANLQLLKFTLGEALVAAMLPYMDAIMNIITNVTAWINENQKLVGWIMTIGVVLGSLLFIIGTVKLGLGAITTKMSGLAAGTIIPMSIGGLAAILGVFTIIAAAWKSDLGNIKKYLKTTFQGLFGDDGALTDIINEFKDIVENIFSALVALFGDDRKGFDTAISKLIINMGEVLLKGLMTLGWLATNTLIWVGNSLVDLLSGTLGSLLLDAVQKFVEIFLLPFITLMRTMDKFNVLPKGMSKIINAYDTFTDNMKQKALDKVDLIPRMDFKSANELKSSLDDIDRFTDSYREKVGLDKENDYFTPTSTPTDQISEMQKMMVSSLKNVNEIKEDGLLKNQLEISMLEKQNQLYREQNDLLNEGNEYKSVFNSDENITNEYDRFITGQY